MAGGPPGPGRARKRTYSVAEANRLLPELEATLLALQQTLGGATDRATARRIRKRASHNGGGAAAAAMLQAGERLRRQLQLLEDQDILLRDVESGLVDFPAEREGEPVFLCWRLGEPSVAHWHGREEGFSRRRPI